MFTIGTFNVRELCGKQRSGNYWLGSFVIITLRHVVFKKPQSKKDLILILEFDSTG